MAASLAGSAPIPYVSQNGNANRNRAAAIAQPWWILSKVYRTIACRHIQIPRDVRAEQGAASAETQPGTAQMTDL